MVIILVSNFDATRSTSFLVVNPTKVVYDFVEQPQVIVKKDLVGKEDPIH